MSAAEWAELRVRFSNLLAQLETRFDLEDVAEVSHFLDNNEFGLAFDALLWCIRESLPSLQKDDVSKIDELAETLDSNQRWKDLRQNLSRSE